MTIFEKTMLVFLINRLHKKATANQVFHMSIRQVANNKQHHTPKIFLALNNVSGNMLPFVKNCNSHFVKPLVNKNQVWEDVVYLVKVD